MQNSTASMKENVSVFNKTTYSLAIWHMYHVLDIYFKDTLAKRWKDTYWQKTKTSWKDKAIHGRIIYNSKNLEIFQMSIKRWQAKQNYGTLTPWSSPQFWSNLREILLSKKSKMGEVCILIVYYHLSKKRECKIYSKNDQLS